MQQLRKKIFLVLLYIAVSFLLPTVTHADEGWVINDFKSEIAIWDNGNVTVNETILVDFGSVPKHGIYRDLPYVYSDANGNKTYTQIDFPAVNMDNGDIPYEVDKNSSNVRLKIGDPNKTITGKHSYVIHYEVKGILRAYTDYDELYWNVTGLDWPVEIEHASATVTLPKPGVVQSACYWGNFGSTQQCIAEKVDEKTVAFSTKEALPTNAGLTVAVGYTHGMVPIITVPAPPSIVEQIQWGALVSAFVLTLAAGMFLVWRRWWRDGRDYWYGHHANPEGQARQIPLGLRESIAPEFASPGNLRPAELGTLVDERADTLDVTATIVDLAVRGYLTIAEEKKKWAFGSADYLLAKKKPADKSLLSYEKLLLESLFASGNEVRLSELKYSFYDDLRNVKDALYTEVVKQDLFTRNPETVRNTYYGVGIALLVVAVAGGGFVLSVGDISSWPLALLVGVAAALTIVSVVLLASAHAMPARTAHGRHVYRQALGYKLFIEKAEKYRAQFMEKENMFETVLPYAIIFGVTEQLARAMKVLELKPSQPGWYYGTHSFNPTAFASDINGFSKTLSTAMASTPQSSGSGGGGFSGGGFGGGGGGSW